MINRPPIKHIPPREQSTWADDTRPGDGLGFALAWCIVAGLAMIGAALAWGCGG